MKEERNSLQYAICKEVYDYKYKILFLKVNHNYFRINKMNNDKINNKKVKYS